MEQRSAAPPPANLNGIRSRFANDPIKALAGNDGKLDEIVFESGPPLPRAGMFFATGCHQGSDLSQKLGCKRDEKGGVIINPKTEESSVPGVYIAGDASRDVLMVAVAIAEGAKAAVAINKAFLRRRWPLRVTDWLNGPECEPLLKLPSAILVMTLIVRKEFQHGPLSTKSGRPRAGARHADGVPDREHLQASPSLLGLLPSSFGARDRL